MSDTSNPIVIGSIIHLRHGDVDGGYLDTRGWVKDKAAFWNVSGTERCFVSTHAERNRDRHSGSWRVVSADGRAEGTPLAVGDTIHLLSMFPGVGYLDCCGWIEHLEPFAPYRNAVRCGVFTAGVPDRDNGTGRWTIRSAAKPDGTALLAGDAITLENGHPQTGVLVAHGRVTDNPHFAEYAGQQRFVFTADATTHGSPASVWRVALSDPLGDNKLLFNFFGPELLKGRTYNMKGVMDTTNVLLADAFQAVGGIALKEVANLVSQAATNTPADNEQRLQQLVAKATSSRNHDLSGAIDHPFQIKQLLNLFTLSRSLMAFDQNTLQKLMLASLTAHQQAKTPPPLYLIRNCFRRTALDHEIIQRATIQRRWNQDEPGADYYQSDQAVELLVMDKLAIKAVRPFQHLLSDDGPLAIITYFSDTTHIHHLPYTDRFVLVGVSYDRVALADDLADDATLTGKAFAAFELMAIPHEVGHTIYQHGRLPDGRTFPEVSRKFRDNPYYRWCEEIFADLYGCIVAGPLSVFSIQAFLTSGDQARAWNDDEEHPTPMLRSYLLAEILRILGEMTTNAGPESAGSRYRFDTVTKNLDEDWTAILGQWGYEGVEKQQSRPTRIYLPDSDALHLERIVNVERVLKAVRPIIREFAALLLAAAAPSLGDGDEPQPPAIPWSRGDADDSAIYAREMATLAGWGTAREAVALAVQFDLEPHEGRAAELLAAPQATDGETDADQRLQAYLDQWGESGPHGWGGH